MKYIYENKKTILKFYNELISSKGSLNFSEFTTINEEKREILDNTVNKWRPFFVSQTTGMLSLMTFVAEKLITSSKRFGLENGDDAAYFFIKIVDPNLLFLEVYESSNTLEEIKELCMKNFRFTDNFLIYLEKSYNKYFQDYKHDELWFRDKIKR